MTKNDQNSIKKLPINGQKMTENGPINDQNIIKKRPKNDQKMTKNGIVT